MSARLQWWLHEWDWRPLVRTIVWLGIAVVAVKRSGYRPPNLGVIAHELVLGWLLSFGLLTWVQIRLAMAAVWLFFKLDDWTYAASEWLVHPVQATHRSPSTSWQHWPRRSRWFSLPLPHHPGP